MSNSLADRLDGIQRKTVAASLSSEAKRDRKRLAEEMRRPIGRAIERGIELARMTKQEVATEMGYSDQSALSRWISGEETPQFARLFGIEPLRQPLVEALSELAGADVEVTVRLKRRTG